MSRFLRHETGTIAVLWSMSLVVFIGFLALVLDIGRLGASQSEFQTYADHVALAAAGELDGNADSITRAKAAAANLITDSQIFADNGAALAYTLTFYATLPTADTTALATPLTESAANARIARYARVVVTPRSLSMSLVGALETLVGGNGANKAVNVTAEAVAGFTVQACDITPLMFCLPSGWETSIDIGDGVLLRSGGNGAAWAPGNFGFIDLDIFKDADGVCSGKGGNQLRCLLAAQESIGQCVNTLGIIQTEPGQKVGITNAAFNVRFDMWKGAMKNDKNDPDYAPAPNVIKGIKPKNGNACNWANEELTTDTAKLPPDTCMPACGRFGDGVWDRQGYLNANHDLDGDPATPATDTHLPVLTGDDTIFNGTRYGMYLREIAYGNTNPNGEGGSGPYSILAPGLSETGRPMCSNQMSNDPARRVVIAAGVDCSATPISGSTSNVPVERYFAFFLTEPVGDDGTSPPTVDILGEFVGYADEPGGGNNGFGGIFRDAVQLYR